MRLIIRSEVMQGRGSVGWDREVWKGEYGKTKGSFSPLYFFPKRRSEEEWWNEN